jgi:hypothetical protein
MIIFFNCTQADTALKIEDLLSNTDIKLEMINSLVQEYSDYDEDYKKIKNRTLFDDWPEQKVPYPQIYLIIKNIEQGGKIADVYYTNRYHDKIKRRQLQYENLYIYYYEKNDLDWNYVIIISMHTGAVLYEQMK